MELCDGVLIPSGCDEFCKLHRQRIGPELPFFVQRRLKQNEAIDRRSHCRRMQRQKGAR